MIFISLGSNLSSLSGDNRFDNINSSIAYFCLHGFKEIKRSSYYETPSYPDLNNPKFINVMTSLKWNGPSLSKTNPDEAILDQLIFQIFEIEHISDRKRIKKNEPRVIDIDIIDYNGKVLNFKTKDSKLFKIPHERLVSRNFVLLPLKEICPDWFHPKTGKQIDELITKLPDIDKKSILKVNYN
ncbi:MAG TPA: 2-amino-4-hydroxy-6-hydroxymethyldihydropteridine diphosphokinase [Pelagibacteraceae bacterium]|jgi:2-amino-4-hydroxy-6-hydroxymethyldihydropteridine diphosphokinase|nr:2-amino-4-hydroxy-6-hydroxymethyldihydropteridine diphosphokinase [Pelagibacteraceae bacterium]|tara:strand:+ start:1265 stop:1816 length:552 start_codon:yes stop_codon:yes gene_type:complete